MNDAMEGTDGVVMVCLHGNERLGLQIRDALEPLFPSFLFVTGNPLAVAHDVRYIDSDLNRSFNGSGKGYEAIRASTLWQHLSAAPYIIDIHTTTARTDHFAIIVENTALTWRLVAACPLAKIVLMTSALSSGGALIEHVPGMSLEFARDVDVADAIDVVRRTLLAMQSDNPSDNASLAGKELYEGFGVLREGSILKNFALYPAGTQVGAYAAPEPFYPVLSGEEAYVADNVTCVMARRVQALPER